MLTEKQQALDATQRRIRRETWQKMRLPLILGLAALIALVAFAGLSPRPSLTANVMMMVMMLCPALLCLFALVIVMIVSVYGMNKVNQTIARPLRRVEGLTVTARQRVEQASDVAARQSANFSVRTAPLENWMNKAFDRKPTPKDTSDE
jgi:ABC-type transport system involved in cytochrome bd biosynthesis fused ATPase/permease subunit